LIHVDLLELVEDKKVVATIPVKYTGVASGVKAGGRLITKMKSLKVKTLPKYLKEQIEVSVDNLEIGGNIRVEDVKEENYEILNSPRIPIVSVVTTRALRQEETVAPATGAAAPAGAPACSYKGRCTCSCQSCSCCQSKKNNQINFVYNPAFAGFFICITNIFVNRYLLAKNSSILNRQWI
jgi:hypothetical protein